MNDFIVPLDVVCSLLSLTGDRQDILYSVCTILKEGTDYKNTGNGLMFTTEAVKYLALMANTPDGDAARKRMIDIEESWNTPSKVMARAVKMADVQLRELSETAEKLQEQLLSISLEKNAATVPGSEDIISIKELSVMLQQSGLKKAGRNTIFEWLRRNGWLMIHGRYRNMPTQKALERGVLLSKFTTYMRKDGEEYIGNTTYVTKKGREYFMYIIPKAFKKGEMENACET